MKRLVAVCMVWASLATVLVAETEVVNGVTWNYQIVQGEAVISAPAIPETTQGAITIPECLGGLPVTAIEHNAFTGCRALNTINLPSTVKSIGDRVFFGCEALESVTLPEGVTALGEEVFKDCPRLTTLHLPASVSNLDPTTFAHSAITTLTIDERNPHYRLIAPFICSKDGTQWFGIWGSPTTLRTPPCVTTIAAATLSETSVTSISLSASVTAIATGAFGNCATLQSIHVDDANPMYASKNGLLLSKDGKTLLAIPGGLKIARIPDGVTTIGSRVSWGDSEQRSVLVPKSVTTICAFAFCAQHNPALLFEGAPPTIHEQGLGFPWLWYCDEMAHAWERQMAEGKLNHPAFKIGDNNNDGKADWNDWLDEHSNK